jgi:hypothetical protein
MATNRTNHNCGDSRLKCVDCGNQVCPNCFVPCPVGNRCQTCSKDTKPESSALKKKLGANSFRNGVLSLLFGGLSGAMIASISFSPMTACFAIVFLLAGRQTGADVRSGDNTLAFSCLLPFCVGMALGTAALYLVAFNVYLCMGAAIIFGAVALGFLLGRSGV